jgi:hypothetical protein
VRLEGGFCSDPRRLLEPASSGQASTEPTAWPGGAIRSLGRTVRCGAARGEANVPLWCVNAGRVEASDEALGGDEQARRVPTGTAIGARRVILLVGPADGVARP